MNLESLQSDDWRKRKEAIEALRKSSPEELPGKLLDLIRENHHNLGMLNAALQLLGSLRDDVLPGLVKLLDDPDPEVRAYALIALAEQKAPQTVPDLIRMISDPDPNVRFNAVEALGNMRAIEAVDRLLMVLRERDFYLGFAAIEALTKIGSPAAVGDLTELLKDEILAPAAVEALGKLGGFSTVPLLLNWLDSHSGEVEPVVTALCELQRRLMAQSSDASLIPATVADIISLNAEQKILKAFQAAIKQTSEDYFPVVLPGLIAFSGWLLGNPNKGRDLRERTEFIAAIRQAMVQLLNIPKLRDLALSALKQTGTEAIPDLIDKFREGGEDVRRAVLATLGSIGDRSAVPLLIEALQSEDGDLPAVAAGALGKIGAPEAFEPLCAQLDHPSALVRQTVIAAINSLGHPAHTDRMLELAQSESPRVREAAIRSLGYFGDPRGVESILQACHDEALSVRQAAVESLSLYDDPRIPELLQLSLQDASPAIRSAAVRALRYMPASFAIPQLIKTLADSDMWVRMQSCRCLAHFRDPAIEQAILNLTNDPMPPVRAAAAEALGNIGGNQSIHALRKLLHDPEPDVRSAAIQGLAETHHPTAVPAIWEMASSSDPYIQLQAIAALGHHGSVDAIRSLQQLLKTTGDPEGVIEALLQSRTPEAIEAIVEAIQHPEQRLYALEACIRLGEAAIPAIRHLLSQPACTLETRLAVIQILHRGHTPQSTALLIKMLTDSSAQVRMAAIYALHEIGSPVARETFAQLAQTDPDPQVQRRARLALGETVP